VTVTPVQLTWQLTLPTRSLSAAWAVFSDTDRFNRAANLGFTFVEEVDAQGRRLKIGQVKRMGLTLHWVDDPFTYVAPHQFISTRRFRNGPLARLETTMRLHPSPDGVVLDYVIRLVPSSWLTRPLVWIDAMTSIKPDMSKVLEAAASQLGDAPRTYAPPPPLPSGALPRVEALRDLPTGPQLERVLREADLRDQDRLRPVELARRWEQDPDQVLNDLLTAVDRGVLEVRFDLICPRCQGPSERMRVLDVRPTDLHCASCGIAYDGSFPDSVEVSFRPAPEVRTFEVPLDCANSPAHSPHRIARQPLPPGHEVELELELEPGAYRLDLSLDRSAALGGASVEVREKLRDRTIAVDAHPHGLVPAILRVGPGTVRIAVRSCLEHDAELIVERRWRPPDTFTAGQLLERDDARALLPSGAVPPSLRITAKQSAILVLDGREAPDAIEHAARRLTHGTRTGSGEHPIATHTADASFIAIYPRFEDALAAARTLVPSPRLAMLVDRGAVTLLTDSQGVLAHGAAVDRAIDHARRLGVGRLAVPTDTASQADVQQAIQRSGMPVLTLPDAPVVFLDTPPAPANPDAALPTSVAGRYALGPELARGGMGIVLSATDATTGQDVVVKVLKPEHASDPSYAQRFFWEARVARSLVHPNTVRVHDYGADGPFVWMVMERLQGEDLHDRMSAQPTLPPAQVVQLGIQALEGLAAAHEQDVVHRDVKPANLFLAREGEEERTKVLDFGIAISVYDDLAMEGGSVPGTPLYLSPEQIERRPLDGRADVYAMGVVLYALLTGRPPFEGSTSRALALIRLAVDPLPIQEIAPHVPVDLARVVMKALEREPEDRWESARAMAQALRALDA